MIKVTKSFLPPIEEYQEYLQKIWNNNWLTNRGPLLLELEGKLKDFFDVQNLTLTTNGTLPLQIAIKALNLSSKEIITTPFSYVATTSSIVWENATPVFVDIHPEYLTIDETKIEAAITKKTKAILATHVFGNPCHVEEIERIAKKHNLKVIYDAAHCFGVNYKEKSIFKYGDISTCSFHATKIFHTSEGGCMISNNKKIQHKLEYSHNFGHKTAESFYGVGINAKMSELQAAMGLAVFKYNGFIKNERKKIVELYLGLIDDTKIQFLKIREFTDWNYHYFPIIFATEEKLLKVVRTLNREKIFPRRYFYPSLNTLPYLNDKTTCPISESISVRVLCLPLYVGLQKKTIKIITTIVNQIK